MYVDEPEHGQFHWVLIESTEDATIWNDIEASSESYDMWLDAFTAGNKALLKHVPDEKGWPSCA